MVVDLRGAARYRHFQKKAQARPAPAIALTI
jgi:hypothetical protein